MIGSSALRRSVRALIALLAVIAVWQLTAGNGTFAFLPPPLDVAHSGLLLVRAGTCSPP